MASLNPTIGTSLVPVENVVSAAVIYDIGEEPQARRIGAAGFEYRQIETREEWLMALVNAFRLAFEEIGHPLPMQVRVTCGWPSKAALAPRHRRIGECWPSEASVDQTVEIFISPCLGTGLDAAETLVHELVHAAGAKGHSRAKSAVWPRAAGAAFSLAWYLIGMTCIHAHGMVWIYSHPCRP